MMKPFAIYLTCNVSFSVYEMADLVDIFPTLVELSGHDPLDKCQNKTTTLCTEGKR